MTNHKSCGRIFRQGKNGRLVKRLRHQPLTLKTWVRFPYRSPQNEALQMECFFHSVEAGTFRPHSREQRALFIAMFIIALFFYRFARIGFEILLRRFRVGSLAGRSKFPYLFAARGEVCDRRSASYLLRLTSPRPAIYRIRGMHQKYTESITVVVLSFFVCWHIG